MNTWGYLILITALLALAAIMLYARFATRSREKSHHHAPIELMFPIETISVAPPAGRDVVVRGPSAGEAILGPEISLDRITGSGMVEKSEGKSGVKSSESDYFDELQDAAAGLAMLMRSSPVGRIDPVVFAPHEDPVSENISLTGSEGELDEVFAGNESALEESHLTGDKSEEFDKSEESDESRLAGEVVEVPLVEESVVRVLSLREILGDQVSDRIELIDEGLDALESLVRSIEASLHSLDRVDALEDDEEMAEESHSFVSEAA